MKKGDARRQAILETAERLFFEKGYEETALQDILDEMSLSKGGFYHHFESKLQLLEAICGARAQEMCVRGVEAAKAAGDDPVRQLNALLREGGFFGEKSIKYVSLMLKTAYGGTLSQLRERMRETMIEQFEAPLGQILLSGIKREIFYVSRPASMPRLLLLLASDVTDEVAFLMAKPQQGVSEMSAMVDLLDAYRRAVELMICAPFGSVQLIDAHRIIELLRSLSILNGQNANIYDPWNQLA
ncbi:MAG: TetR/AcrR family transcriptional regulator [Clostridia bacterium]